MVETQLEFDFMKPTHLTLDFDNNIYFGRSDCHKILTIASYQNITFNSNEKIVGKLDWSDGKMKFEGEADESAQLFFDNIIKRYVQTQLPLNGGKS